MSDLDFNTLMVCSLMVTSICGVLFLNETLRRREAHGVLWASALACTTVAPSFYLLAAAYPSQSWGYAAGNAVVVGGISLVWSGARRFNGKRPRISVALAGPAITLFAAVAEPGPTGSWSGATPFFFAFSAYSIATAGELWQGGVRYRNAIPFVLGCLINGVFYAARGLTLAVTGPDHPLFRAYFNAEVAALEVMMLIVICTFSLIAIGKEKSEIALHRAATRDGLTDALNRREFMRRAELAMRATAAARAPASVLLIDLDFFKKINDTYGHPIGDQVLVVFAKLAADAIRPCDLLCRYGGEEFVIVMPDISERQALAMAEEIRTRFAGSVVPTEKGPLRPTASIGVASNPHSEASLAVLISRADAALYRAKSAGRNRVAAPAKAA